MTTAPTNEMMALADELDTKLPVFHGRERDLIVRVVTALRLAANPSARDVREACKRAVMTILQENGYHYSLLHRKIVVAIDALSNLDATAPASGGDETIGFAAWHPVHGFGAINELAIREHFSHAKTDANLANHSSGGPRWQVVPVSVVKGNLT